MPPALVRMITIFFPNFIFKRELYYHLPTGQLKRRKTLAIGIRIQKNLQTRRTFSGFSQIFVELHGFNFHPCMKTSAIALLTPELSIKGHLYYKTIASQNM